jgi:osmotically-inducible protein OsmY
MSKTEDIRIAVEDELSFDPLVDAADITIENTDGDVALSGTVPSYPQYLEAADAARRIAGVTSVHNYLEVELPPDDYRDDTALTTTANEALALNVAVPGTVNATARDGNITLMGTVEYGSQHRNALIPDDSDVTVDTSGNTVTLAGHVRTWAEHDAVEDAAWRTAGVYDVHDKLAVTG